MNFDGFYGNDRAKEYLNSAFARKAFPHALLIAGERGIGKKTLAGIVARALVCEAEDSPCESCASCHKSKNGFHPDIVMLGSEEATVKVEEIRNLKRDALLRPNDAERKVYIITNSGSMTHDAQDAFLKILEEPPHFTFFILLCNTYSDLLPTIVSRTSHIMLSPLADEDMMKVINKEKPEITEEQARELIRISGGICSFLVEETNKENIEYATSVANALISRDELKIFRALTALEKLDRTNLSGTLDELIIIMRDAVISASGAAASPLSRADRITSEKISQTFSVTVLCKILDEIISAKNSCLRNVGTAHITGNLICKFANTVASATSKG